MLESYSEVELAWLAGVVDGEGCFRINLPGLKGNRRYHGTPSFTIAMGHRPTMERVGEMLGKPPSKQGWLTGRIRQLYGIRLFGENALMVARILRPYLLTKAEEAWLLLEMRAQCPKRMGGQDPLSIEEKALRLGYSLALKNAKKLSWETS